MTATRWVALGLFFGACQPNVGLRDRPLLGGAPQAVIEVDPLSVDFGERRRDESVSEVITLFSTGASPLVIDAIDLAGAQAFHLSGAEAEPPWELDPGESLSLEVRFSPDAGGDASGEVVVVSNAINEPDLSVPLLGRGALGALQLSPNPVRFGQRFVSCVTTNTVTLRNIGEDSLDVIDLDVDADAAYTITSAPSLPFTLQPDQAVTVDLAFLPLSQGDHIGELWVAPDVGGVITSDLEGEGTFVSSVHESFYVEEPEPVNFLFAVDQSCSMGNVQTQLANNFTTFVSRLSQANASWKAAVVTTGLSNGSSGSATECFVNGVLGPHTPNLLSTFQQSITFGFQTSGARYSDPSEMLLDRAYQALRPHRTGPGSCNAGFLDGSDLHIVFISDERDQSPGTGMGGAVVGQNPSSGYISGYVGEYVAAAAPGFVTAHAIVDMAGTHSSGGSCAGPDGGPYGYREVAQQLGGFTFDICSANWGSILGDIADSAIQDRRNFRLNTNLQLHEPTLDVRVNGVPQTSGWTWLSASRTVSFDSDIPGDSVVDVRGGTVPNCP